PPTQTRCRYDTRIVGRGMPLASGWPRAIMMVEGRLDDETGSLLITLLRGVLWRRGDRRRRHRPFGRLLVSLVTQAPGNAAKLGFRSSLDDPVCHDGGCRLARLAAWPGYGGRSSRGMALRPAA